MVNIPASGGIEGSRLNDVNDTQEAQLGSRVFGANGQVFVYVKAAETLALTDALCINPADFTVNKLTKALVDAGRLVASVPVLISQVTSITTTNPYFWACVAGVTDVNCITGSTASVSAVYTTGTAGALGTASGSQTQIRGVVFTATNSSGATASRQAVLNNPQSYLF